jgi:hypothetical protein
MPGVVWVRLQPLVGRGGSGRRSADPRVSRSQLPSPFPWQSGPLSHFGSLRSISTHTLFTRTCLRSGSLIPRQSRSFSAGSAQSFASGWPGPVGVTVAGSRAALAAHPAQCRAARSASPSPPAAESRWGAAWGHCRDDLEESGDVPRGSAPVAVRGVVKGDPTRSAGPLHWDRSDSGAQ